MSKTIYRLFEYAYIVMAIFAGYIVATSWESDRGRAYLFGFFGVLAIFMFIFKRWFRRRLEKRNEDQ